MDVVAPEIRSRMMSGIRGKNTKPEIIVRKMLHATGFRFRLHRTDLPGAPDILLPRRRVAIFVHGCFWHMHEGCKYAKLPSSNERFWREKLARNAERDSQAIFRLAAAGWRVLTIWECSTREREALDELAERTQKWILGVDQAGQIP